MRARSLIGVWIASLALGLATPAFGMEPLSSMPERPTIRGMRFVFWHQLQELHEGYYGWLNADEAKHIYRELPALGLDMQASVRHHRAIYETVLKDYQELLAAGDIDSYGEIGWGGSGNRPLSNQIKYRLTLAKVIHRHAFLSHYGYARLLELLFTDKSDSRLSAMAFFFGPQEPLESVVSLSRSSSRAQQVIARILKLFAQQISLVDGEIDEVLQKPLDWQELHKTRRDADAIHQRIDSLVSHLQVANQFSNDLVRSKKMAEPELDQAMTNLGVGLKSVLSATDAHEGSRRQRKRLGQFQFTGAYLANPLDDLDHLFNIPGSSPNERSDGKVYDMYRDSLKLQYIVAAGSIMAKISEVPSGRGGFASRMAQELRYRTASLLGTSKDAGRALVIAEQRPADFLPQTKRRDFASPALQKQRSEVEDRLWRIFFENSGLFAEDFNPKINCTPRLTSGFQTGGLERKF